MRTSLKKIVTAVGLLVVLLLAGRAPWGAEWTLRANAQGSVPTRVPTATSSHNGGSGGSSESTSTPLPPLPGKTATATSTSVPSVEPPLPSETPQPSPTPTASPVPANPEPPTVSAAPTQPGAPGSASGGSNAWYVYGLGGLVVLLAFYLYWRRSRGRGADPTDR